MRRIRYMAIAALAAVAALISLMPALAEVDPASVEAVLSPGESMTITKTVTTPAIPPVVDVCLLEDETGSFGDDIGNLQGGTTASDIYDNIVGQSPGAQFAVAGFRDYPQAPHGGPNDWVYHLLSGMSPAKANWLAGINALTAGGGADGPEAQYDAIVAATGPGIFNDPTEGPQGDCGWRDPLANPGVQRVLVVTTDAPFHLPGGGKPHVNNQATTIAALTAQNIIVVGLKAPGSGGELDALAAATGGSVQPLSSNGADIADAILAGLAELTTDVWFEFVAQDGLAVTLTPDVYYDVPGNTVLHFEETIAVDPNLGLEDVTLHAKVTFIANDFPLEGAPIGRQMISIEIPSVLPECECVEAVNPHGKNVPKAPGKGGQGQNQDGFYQANATDNLTPDDQILIYVENADGSWRSSAYPNGSVFKITEAPGATPAEKYMGSTNGQAGAVAAHITLDTDPVFVAVDLNGNEGKVSCLVPPPPK